MPRGTPGRDGPKRQRVTREIPSCLYPSLRLFLLLLLIIIYYYLSLLFRGLVPIRAVVIVEAFARASEKLQRCQPQAGSEGGEPGYGGKHGCPRPPAPARPAAAAVPEPHVPSREVAVTRRHPGDPSPPRPLPPPPLPAGKETTRGGPCPLAAPRPGPAAVLTRRR